jgi:cysteine-rich repeat protein
VVQLNWECINLSGFPSNCSPKVVIPNCGNGILEPEKGEACDDGNLVNGDGCNYFCQVEPDWICIDGKICINVRDPNQFKVLCGNGKVEGAEVCDDGNTLEGDGCSSVCKVESGWECGTYSPLESKSYCRRIINSNSYCGDGVVQGSE